MKACISHMVEKGQRAQAPAPAKAGKSGVTGMTDSSALSDEMFWMLLEWIEIGWILSLSLHTHRKDKPHTTKQLHRFNFIKCQVSALMRW